MVGQFIAIDRETSIGSKLSRGKKYAYTVMGNVIFDIGAIVPVIWVGHDCIGVARIHSLFITEDTTRIEFIGVDSSQTYSALYAMYQLSIRSSPTSDPYVDDDSLIPGFTSSSRTNNLNASKNYDNSGNRSNLSGDYKGHRTDRW